MWERISSARAESNCDVDVYTYQIEVSDVETYSEPSGIFHWPDWWQSANAFVQGCNHALPAVRAPFDLASMLHDYTTTFLK